MEKIETITTTEWPQWLFFWSIPLALGLLYLSYVIDAGFHEGGHAIACVAQGYKILSWSVLTPGHSDLNCTNNSTALFAIAGSLSSVLAWAVLTTIFWLLWLPRLRNVNWRRLLSALWASWSFWCLGEIVFWSLQTSEHPPSDDSARFVAATGINPQFVIALALALVAILIVVLVLPAAFRLWRKSSCATR